MTMTKRDLKKTVQVAMDSKYGFKASLDNIILLEGSDDRTYIRFKVRGHEYVFDSYTFADGSVWCGEGTLEQVS